MTRSTARLSAPLPPSFAAPCPETVRSSAPPASQQALARICRSHGLSLWRQGRLAEAEAALADAAHLAPDDVHILAEHGSLLCAAGRMEEALTPLRGAVERAPENAQAWLTLAGALAALGVHASAELAYQRVLALTPNSAEAVTGLGLLYIELRQFEWAAGLLRAAAARGVRSFALDACLGQTLFQLGEFSEAATILARGAPFGGAPVVRKYALCRMLSMLENDTVEAAMAAYQTAAGDYAQDLDAVCREALHVLAGYGRLQPAVALAQRLCAQAPDDPILAYQLDALTERRNARAPRAYVTACFDKYAASFDAHLVDTLGYRAPQICAHMLESSGLAPFGRALDLGCGTGLAAPHLAPFCGDLTGVDLSSQMLERARQRGLYARLMEADALDHLLESDATYDLIVALDILIYFGDLGPLIEAAAARLKPGGLFAFSYETDPRADYALRPSGRFSHSNAYLDALCGRDFSVVTTIDTTLRLEAARPVAGRIALMQRLPRAANALNRAATATAAGVQDHRSSRLPPATPARHSGRTASG